MTVSTRHPAPRLHAVDTAKGIAILFVVFGHAWRGVHDAGVLQNEVLFRTVDQMIYAWHMPLFFFLSGLHFLGSALKAQPVPFLSSRTLRLLWPMALWTWIFFGFKLAAGGAVNTPVTLADFPLNPLPPYEHLWFLWALFLIQMTTFACIAAVRGRVSARRIRGGVAVASIMIVAVLTQVYVASEYIGLAIANAPFFLMGCAVGATVLAQERPWIGIACGLGIAVMLFGATQGWPAAPVSLALVLLIWIIMPGVDRGRAEPGRVLKGLRHLGQASMAIYLAHTIFAAGFRIGLLKLGVESVPFHLLVAVLVSCIGPLVLLRGVQKMRLQKVLGL